MREIAKGYLAMDILQELCPLTHRNIFQETCSTRFPASLGELAESTHDIQRVLRCLATYVIGIRTRAEDSMDIAQTCRDQIFENIGNITTLLNVR